MAGQGDIGDLVGIADTISSPPGTITTRPLIPASWQTATPTLVTQSYPAPPAQGDIIGDAPSGTNPDFFVGSFTLQSVSPTLGTGSHSAPAGQGDVSDVFGAPDLAGEAQVGGLAAFSSVTVTLGLGTVTHPADNGDVGDVGGPTTLQGDVNDSNAGVGTLTSWSNGSSTLGLGSIPQPAEHGDIGEMYGLAEGPIGQPVWAAVTVTLVTQATTIPQGQGDIHNPWSWEDAIYFLTSWTYPTFNFDHVTGSSLTYDAPQFPTPGSLTSASNLLSGTFTTNLLTYSNWPAEHIQSSSNVSAGTLVLALITYSNWPAEHIQSASNVLSGTLVLALVNYTNWPAEHIQSASALLGGTLT